MAKIPIKWDHNYYYAAKEKGCSSEGNCILWEYHFIFPANLQKGQKESYVSVTLKLSGWRNWQGHKSVLDKAIETKGRFFSVITWSSGQFDFWLYENCNLPSESRVHNRSPDSTFHSYIHDEELLDIPQCLPNLCEFPLPLVRLSPYTFSQLVLKKFSSCQKQNVKQKLDWPTMPSMSHEHHF